MNVEPDAAFRTVQDLLQAWYADAAPRISGTDARVQAANVLPVELGHLSCAIGCAIHRVIVTDYQNTVATGPQVELDLVRA